MIKKIFSNPFILIWLSVSFLLLVLSVVFSTFYPEEILIVIICLVIAQFSSSIFFPIIVGYFYDKIREKHSGEEIWSVFNEFLEGGIIRIYKDRENNGEKSGAVSLKNKILNHKSGEIKIVGVSLRVFFHEVSFYYQAIQTTAFNHSSNVEVKVLTVNPNSPEAKNRDHVESMKGTTPTTEPDIQKTAKSILNLTQRYQLENLNLRFYDQAPYCTLVIFPDSCYFSPNILSLEAPAKLPLLVFNSSSHSYKVLNSYFDLLWDGGKKIEKIEDVDGL